MGGTFEAEDVSLKSVGEVNEEATLAQRYRLHVSENMSTSRPLVISLAVNVSLAAAAA